MEIFSNHAHLIYEENAENAVGKLLRHLDESGISSSVTFAPFAAQAAGVNTNSWLSKAIKGQSRLIGFGTIDFNNDIQSQLNEIAQLGFLGIKIHPAYQKINILDSALMSVYEFCEKQKLFISFHTGVHWHRIADYNQLLFDEVAYKFPALKFSMEHVGGYCFFKEAVAVLTNSKNTYAGLTSVSSKTKQRYWYLNNEQMSDLMWQIGASRCIFGLDYPYNTAADNKSDIQRILDLDITHEEKALILGGNLAEILRKR